MRPGAAAPQYRAANQREVDVVTAEMTSDTFAQAIAKGGAVKAANAKATPAEAPSGIQILAFPIILDEDIAKELDNIASSRPKTPNRSVKDLGITPMVRTSHLKLLATSSTTF